ncbi:hypothetical protein Lal_00007637 [Lupinus albus]|uniref:SKP1-like protein n=1 Tax=Lupinus albus TaxID=3870 RepID=A0A6A5MJ96_LUPAL|nr:putative S-phase kinase-associated protein [Lupinus albus]KAF1875021.1 hypothetical protein Lal_00007637 [Lupinus albus]
MTKTAKKIILKSSDGVSFEVDEAVARQSETIKHLIEDGCTENGIPLPNVTGEILAKIVQYCKKHVETSGSEKKSNAKALCYWDAQFVKVDQATLLDLIMAANYLNIKKLLDRTCQAVADMIKGKSPEEIRKILNIQNDFSPEEEQEIRRENHWGL